ncbi:MAG: NAD-dependent epimerase/dehydratase family protein [bacterium]|nr:NAD-dependent epimerase/dehydratase family protein [bacterium]
MKISRQALVEKRSNKECVFLVTGGTGFIGSHTAMELLKRGYRVVLLCRPGENKTASERVNRLLNWFQMQGRKELSKLEVVEGFFNRPNFGLTDRRYAYLSETVDEIVHCAADTAFLEKKREQVETANVKSLENLLALAAGANGKCYYFHHVSTAYVAGKRTGNCEEALVETNAFHNVYEETKYRAEQYVWKVFPGEGIRVNIFRPSIVYGNSETGRSLRFNALYYPVKMALFLKNTYRKDITERGGEKARQMGVKMMENGDIYLPIRMEKKENGGIDLIPINYFTDAFMAIMEDNLESGIFHIVGGSPKKLEDIINYCRELFCIQGISGVHKENFVKTPPNALEILFSGYLKMYGPYMCDTRRFDNRKAKAILQKKNITCPEFDFNIFQKCMEYAVSVDWGRRHLK